MEFARQPIATAPKNGQCVTLFGGGHVAVGYWEAAASTAQSDHRGVWREEAGGPLGFEPTEWVDYGN